MFDTSFSSGPTAHGSPEDKSAALAAATEQALAERDLWKHRAEAAEAQLLELRVGLSQLLLTPR